MVTKIPPGGNYPEGVRKYFKKSLDLLQVDYLDLYLVHLPFRLRDADDEILPHKPDGEIDMIMEVDHIGIWKVSLKAKNSTNLIDSILGDGKAFGIRQSQVDWYIKFQSKTNRPNFRTLQDTSCCTSNRITRVFPTERIGRFL